MRSQEAECNLKSYNSPEENHNQTPAAHEEFHDQTFAPQVGFDYSEGRVGSSSASGSDSDSESNGSDSGSDSGSYSSSRSRNSSGSWSGSSGYSESDVSSSSEGLEGTDDDVYILSDDEKEAKHKAEACDQRMSLPIPVKSQNEVDIEKESPEEREAKMALTTTHTTISDRVRKYAEETRPFAYDYQQRKDYIGSSSGSFDKLSKGTKRDIELKNIDEKSEGTKRLKVGNLPEDTGKGSNTQVS